MAEGGHNWNPPQWSDHGKKHFAAPGSSWDAVVKKTGEGKRIAKYHLRLSEQEIRTMELAIVNAEKNEIPQSRPNVRAFWSKVKEDQVPIGASDGRETPYVYVEYVSSGPVHGRPITESQLRQKGVTL